MPLAKLKAKGNNELAHSFVMSGCVCIQYSNGLQRKEELVLPPRQLTSTSAAHVGTSIMDCLERHLFGTSFATWISNISNRFGAVNFIAVADSATSNVKCISQMFSFARLLGRQYGITVTACFTSCLLHQCARMIALHLEHQSMATSLFSITRLHQHANARAAVKDAMKIILQKKFKCIRDRDPPDCVGTSERFRLDLFKLLSGLWTGEVSAEEASVRKELIKEALEFFNGDILQTEEIQHFCPAGCHRSEQAALDHATRIEFISVFNLDIAFVIVTQTVSGKGFLTFLNGSNCPEKRT